MQRAGNGGLPHRVAMVRLISPLQVLQFLALAGTLCALVCLLSGHERGIAWLVVLTTGPHNLYLLLLDSLSRLKRRG